MTLDLDVRDPNDVMAKLEREAKEQRDKALLAGTDVDPQVAFTLMRASASRIHSKLAGIEAAQLFHYHRERRHRETVDSTDLRLQWWSLGESAIVFLSAALQVAIVQFWWFKESPNAFFSPAKKGKGGASSMMRPLGA